MNLDDFDFEACRVYIAKTTKDWHEYYLEEGISNYINALQMGPPNLTVIHKISVIISKSIK